MQLDVVRTLEHNSAVVATPVDKTVWVFNIYY